MRTQLELWKIVQENFDRYFQTGLCGAITDLYIEDKLNFYSEREILMEEVRKYRNDNEYYWLGKRGDKQPRIDFINKMIELHSKDQ